jgi:hypothetical protein
VARRSRCGAADRNRVDISGQRNSCRPRTHSLDEPPAAGRQPDGDGRLVHQASRETASPNECLRRALVFSRRLEFVVALDMQPRSPCSEVKLPLCDRFTADNADRPPLGTLRCHEASYRARYQPADLSPRLLSEAKTSKIRQLAHVNGAGQVEAARRQHRGERLHCTGWQDRTLQGCGRYAMENNGILTDGQRGCHVTTLGRLVISLSVATILHCR